MSGHPRAPWLWIKELEGKYHLPHLEFVHPLAQKGMWLMTWEFSYFINARTFLISEGLSTQDSEGNLLFFLEQIKSHQV